MANFFRNPNVYINELIKKYVDQYLDKYFSNEENLQKIRDLDKKGDFNSDTENIIEINFDTDYLYKNINLYDTRYSKYDNSVRLINKLKDIAKKNKFVIFEDNSKDFNLNIWFSRSLKIEEDKFKDICIIFWKGLDNKWEVRLFKFNTNPGIFWLKTPQNPDGTAIIYPGQYRSTHKIDIHRKGSSSAHQALCHRKGIIKVIRDNNKDEVLDLDGRVYTNGLGINIHRPTLYTEQTGKVDKSSAGCLIARFRDQFDNENQNDKTTNTFMGLCRLSKSNWGTWFSITVIDDSNY